MVRQVTKEGIASVLARGGMATPVPKEPPPEVKIEGMAEAVDHYHLMKHERQKSHEAMMEQKLAKLDELIEAVKNDDMVIAMKAMVEIQAGMLALKVRHEKREEIEDMEDDLDDDDEPCEYKLTGRRDRRGLIDLEYGLTFTPVKGPVRGE